MKAEMCASGTLKVSAENELEAYALRTWAEQQKALPKSLIVDHSFPVTINKVTGKVESTNERRN